MKIVHPLRTNLLLPRVPRRLLAIEGSSLPLFKITAGKSTFRHIASDEMHEIITTSKVLKIVETVPGWSHNITNIGKEDVVVMLWANEILDRANMDTIAHKV